MTNIETNDKYNHKENKINNIQSQTNGQLIENLDIDKEQIKKELERAKNVEERVKTFSKRTDKYGLEAIFSFIPVVGDLTPAIISTCYLIAEGAHIGLSRKDCLKILGYQTADVLIGFIPLIGDVADFFFKSNKYSSEIFEKHVEKLQNAALKQGISQSEIDNMGKKQKKFIKRMDKYLEDKQRKKSSKKKPNNINL